MKSDSASQPTGVNVTHECELLCKERGTSVMCLWSSRVTVFEELLRSYEDLLFKSLANS